ncbi:hypothetical protein ACSBR1_016319 [Camellia fascicularis]
MCSHIRQINKDALSAMIFLMLSLFLLYDSVSADPKSISCDPSPTNYTPNSQFGNNLKILLESLSSNTPLNQGFNSTTIENNTDQVYGQALCRGDVTPEVCQDCIKNASQEIMTVCPTQNAIIWHEFCQVRYSHLPFFSSMVYNGLYPDSNKQEKNISDRVSFIKVLKDFMNKLSDEATVNPSNLMFVTGQRKKITVAMLITGATTFVLAGLAAGCYVIRRQRSNGTQKDEERSHSALLHELANPPSFAINQEGEFVSSQELPFMELATIMAATDNFSDSNKLGQGGFGIIYKGQLPDGKEVAVKRLSSVSEQGLDEFTNEVLLILKLQHKNLVRLLGFCIDGDEKLLIYEYMPNGSLDVFLLDPRKRAQMNWGRSLNIINGIARGMLYLHEDSRLRIIHRDLKPSNVLLDSELNPKISDFGMARIFGGSDDAANTARIVGTYGYMAPEFAMEGLYSVKSDVFSFGVLLIEIITGRRNATFHLTKCAPSLIAFVWQLWNEGKGLEMIDPLLMESCDLDEFLRYMHIGLLCVQEDAYDRPTMSSVVVMLKSEAVTLSQPERPAFSVGEIQRSL